MENVCVMMSTYNGEKYIEDQLNSILNQQGVKAVIYIRDDGSTDDTLSIIDKYVTSFPDQIHLIKGENIGWKKSFLYLIYNIADGYKYYSISDQDDVWKEDKLKSALSVINTTTFPMLYASNLEVCDKDLSSRHYLYNQEIDYQNLENCFFNGCSPYGCTFVWNDALHKTLKKEKPKIDVAYDQWIHFVARTKGNVFVDHKSHIFHRIHEKNAAGVETNQIKRIRKFFRLYMVKDYVRSSDMTEEYLRIYGKEISGAHRNSINLWGNIHNKSVIGRCLVLKQKEIKMLTIKQRLRILLFAILNKL